VTHILVSWVLSAVLFLVLSKLPIGVRVDGFPTALLVALVFGLLNSTLWWVLQILALPITVLSLGLFYFVVNGFVFWMAASLVPGMRLEHGFWSAILGSVVLSVLNGIVHFVFR
jgi:putative membrane protein